MANLPKCKRCGVDIRAESPHATNKRFCGKDCSDTWWNELRSRGETQGTVARKRLGCASPTLALTDVQAAWLAALIDGEGSIGIWRERRPKNSSGWRYRAAVQINNTNLDIINQARDLVDGYATTDNNAWRRNPKHKILYRVHVNRRAVRALLEAVKRFLVIKQRQADVVVMFCEVVANAPMRASVDHELFERLYQEAKALNKRGV